MSTRPPPDPDADVMASELNTHAYCEKSWHLQHVRRVPPSRAAVAQRAAGTAHHARHGASATRATRLGPVALVLLLAALLLGVVAAAAWWLR
jgi:hypothetical protein